MINQFQTNRASNVRSDSKKYEDNVRRKSVLYDGGHSVAITDLRRYNISRLATIYLRTPTSSQPQTNKNLILQSQLEFADQRINKRLHTKLLEFLSFRSPGNRGRFRRKNTVPLADSVTSSEEVFHLRSTMPGILGPIKHLRS